MRMQPAAASQTRETMQPQQTIQYPSPDLALTDPAAYQQQLTAALNAQQQATMAAYAAPVFSQLATTAKELSKADPKHATYWNKYGSEIEKVVANVPEHLRTKDLYDKAVVMVKGEHADEIAAEAVNRITSANADIARSGGSGAPPADSGSADIWDRIEKTPIGAAMLRSTGKSGIITAIKAGAYQSLEQLADLAEKSKARVNAEGTEIANNV